MLSSIVRIGVLSYYKQATESLRPPKKINVAVV